MVEGEDLIAGEEAALARDDDLALERSRAALTAKYWFGRAIFLMPASNNVKSWTNSSNRAGTIIWVTSRSSGPLISLSSFQASQ